MSHEAILTALNTTPATLIALTQLYPGLHYTMRGNDESDWVGQITGPSRALAQAEAEWGTEALICLDEPTVGLLAEDAMLLLHLHGLVQAGVPKTTAREHVNALRVLLGNLDNLRADDDLLLGYIPLFSVDAATGATEPLPV